jgi:hypothetical protein
LPATSYYLTGKLGGPSIADPGATAGHNVSSPITHPIAIVDLQASASPKTGKGKQGAIDPNTGFSKANDRMDTILSRFHSEDAMHNSEEMDGFFAALICSPEIAKPNASPACQKWVRFYNDLCGRIYYKNVIKNRIRL